MNSKSNYVKHPVVSVEGDNHQAFEGYDALCKELRNTMNEKKSIVVDCYPGVRINEITENLIVPLGITNIFFSDDIFISGEQITERIKRYLTEDRVFGILSNFRLDEFIDQVALIALRDRISLCSGRFCIIGVGASLVYKGDLILYADLARWEIQKRYRSHEIGNWKCNNHQEDILLKYKRGYFVEWRMADLHKRSVFRAFDYFIDTNLTKNPKMIASHSFHEGLRQTANKPFRIVPFFDPGVWGGQWMKEVCDLDSHEKNYAWCFDGVPEENSLLLQYGKVVIQMPSINLVFLQPQKLLGEAVHARFGMEFPIRFDFLDTMDGQNLSLQVHPLTEYIQERFGMHYTQDESYYILDAKEDGTVYLGLKENVDANQMINDLYTAQKGSTRFPDEKYINCFTAKKHDHFLIPAGTIHCSGKNTMILEISATPYIFTFKLWDWDRLGLDGLPRPIHIEHGSKAIQFDRDTAWVQKNLVNRIELISRAENHVEERTGLHEREFIETRRHTFSAPIELSTDGGVQMLNLIEGNSLLIESPNKEFEPYEVHYAETFIIPASVGDYVLRPQPGAQVKVIRAYVRNK